MATYGIGDPFRDPGGLTPITDDTPMPIGGGALGAVDDASEINPSNDATVIALLKGILETNVAMLAILTDVHQAGTHDLKVDAA